MKKIIYHFKKKSTFNFLFVIICSLYTINFISAQTLDDYIQIAKQNNSAIKEKIYDFELAKEKTNEVGLYENTRFALGVFASTPETRVGSQSFNVGVSQKIPWIGALKAEKDLAKEKVVNKKIDISLSEKDLVYQVKVLYYNLYQKQAVQEVLRTQKQVLKIYEEMANHAMANDLSTMSEVLDIHIQNNELHSKTFQIYTEIEALSKNFNRLLERDVKTILNIPTSLNVLDILIGNPKTEAHPLMENIKQLNSIYDAENTLIDKYNAPQISIGVDYILVNKRNDVNINENGKDIWMPKVILEVPISKAKKKAQKRQIEIKKDKLFYTLKNQKRELEIAMETAIFNFHNALVQVVAAQKNTKETQRIIDLYINDYQVGTLKYTKILKLQLKKIQYQLMEIEAIKNAFMAKSEVEYLSE